MRLTISQEDIDRGKTVEPGWYDVVVAEAVDELSKDGQSTNTVIDFQITGGNEGKFNGMKVRTWFSEKAPGLAIPYFEAFGVKVAAGVSLDPVQTKGRKLKIYVANEQYQGRSRNVVKDYRPAA